MGTVNLASGAGLEFLRVHSPQLAAYHRLLNTPQLAAELFIVGRAAARQAGSAPAPRIFSMAEDCSNRAVARNGGNSAAAVWNSSYHHNSRRASG